MLNEKCPTSAKIPPNFNLKKFPGIGDVIKKQEEEYKKCQEATQLQLQFFYYKDSNDPFIKEIQNIKDELYRRFTKGKQVSNILIFNGQSPNEYTIASDADNLQIQSQKHDKKFSIKSSTNDRNGGVKYYNFEGKSSENIVSQALLILELCGIIRNPRRYGADSIIFIKKDSGLEIWGHTFKGMAQIHIPIIENLTKSLDAKNVREIINYIEDLLGSKSGMDYELPTA